MKFRKLVASALFCSLTLQLAPLSAAEMVPGAVPVDSVKSGEDMLIAVLDNGFILEHESFVITDTTPALTKEKSDALLASTTVGASDNAPDSLYVSAKIPFAYDYGDGDSDLTETHYSYHGTAMISIAAGNGALLESKNPAATGIAPEAQILAMKVYSDKKETVTEAAMVSAIEDAIVLGAHVILIPLTEHCGVSFDPASERLIAAVKKADEAGIIVVCPAGDVLEYGKESVYALEYETTDPPATNPDIGTIAWPGTLDSVLTVGSSEGNTVETEFFTLSDGKKIPFGDSNYLYTTITGGKTFAEYFDGQSLEYVIVDGSGTLEDFTAAGDLTGKLTVVTRGTLSFNEKAKNAAACGAIGMLVLDNQPDKHSALRVKMDISESTIPVVIIPTGHISAIKNAADRRIMIKAGETYIATIRSTPSPSSYSARGTTPELGLKPDITVVGSTVQCAAVNGGYGYMSSTEASAAKVAGMCAILVKKLSCDYPNLTSGDLSARVKAKLVGSAELMVQEPSGTPYSPRVQGGGNATLDAALSAELLLTSNGAHKIELGDNHTRMLSFKVTAENLSDTAKECTLDTTCGSDDFVAYTYAELDIENPDDPLYKRLGTEPTDTLAFIRDFTALSGANVVISGTSYQLNPTACDYKPYTFILGPGESQTFDLVVCLNDDTYTEYRKHFTNGFFIEGFVRLISNDQAASIPFLGYSGSFGAAPYLDADIYSGAQAIYDEMYLYRRIDYADATDNKRIILGADTHSEPTDYTEYNKGDIAFSPIIDRANAKVMLNFALLRTVSDISVTVTDAIGNIVEQKNYGTVPRTYVSNSTGMPTTASLPLWNGRADDNVSYIYPDGLYTVTVSYSKPISLVRESFSYDIFLDTTAPTLVSAEFVTEDEKPVLVVTAEDNHRIMRCTVVDSDRENAYTPDDCRFDISNLFGEYIYVDIFDYSANSTVVRLENPHYVPGND